MPILLVLLALSPSLAFAECDRNLAPEFSVGQWVLRDVGPAQRLPARIREVHGDRVVATQFFEHEPVEIPLGELRAARSAEARWITRFLERSRREAEPVLAAIAAAGGRASMLSDHRHVVIESAPRARTFTRSNDPELLFNHPDLVNDVIARVEALGGKVVWLPQLFHNVWGYAGAISTAGYGDERYSSEARFCLHVGRWTTLATLYHEMIHVEDLIVNPIPELGLARLLVLEPRRLRDKMHNWAVKEKIDGTLETRAYALGNGRYVREGHVSKFKWDSIESFCYELWNRSKLARGNCYLDPSFASAAKAAWMTGYPLALLFGAAQGVIAAERFVFGFF